MSDREKESYKTLVGFAVLVIDDYTGQIITDNRISVAIDCEGKYIRKPDGFFVFMNLDVTEFTLIIKSKIYVTYERKINLIESDKQNPFLKIRITPNQYYPFNSGTTYVTGDFEPDVVVRVIKNDIQEAYRLLSDYKTTNEIHIYNPSQSDLEEKLFRICDSNNKEMLYIDKIMEHNQGIYSIAKVLENKYKKADTKLYPVYEATVDSSGRLFLPIYDFNDFEKECSVEILKRSEIIKKIESFRIIKGENNVITTATM